MRRLEPTTFFARATYVLLAALLVLGLAGCASNDDSLGDEIEDTADEVSDEVEDAADEAGDAMEEAGEAVEEAAEDAGDGSH